MVHEACTAAPETQLQSVLTPMFGHVTALEGLHVIRKIQEFPSTSEFPHRLIYPHLAYTKQPPPRTLQGYLAHEKEPPSRTLQ